MTAQCPVEWPEGAIEAAVGERRKSFSDGGLMALLGDSQDSPLQSTVRVERKASFLSAGKGTVLGKGRSRFSVCANMPTLYEFSGFRKRQSRADQACLQDSGQALSPRPVSHWIGHSKRVPSAPVSPQIVEAKKVFIANAGGDERWYEKPIFSGGSHVSSVSLYDIDSLRPAVLCRGSSS